MRQRNVTVYLSTKIGSSSGSNSLEKIRLKFWVNFSGERTSRTLSMLSKSIWGVEMEMEIHWLSVESQIEA